MSMATMAGRVQFRYDCDGLRAAVESACRPGWRATTPDPGIGFMTADDVVVWLTRQVVRKARALQLIKEEL